MARTQKVPYSKIPFLIHQMGKHYKAAAGGGTRCHHFGKQVGIFIMKLKIRVPFSQARAFADTFPKGSSSTRLYLNAFG